MEEVIEELSKIFEFSNAKQTELISSKLAEFRSEIQKQGNPPPSVIKLNTSEISHEIKAHLGDMNIKVDDSNLISAIKQELKKHDSVLTQTKSEMSNLIEMFNISVNEIRKEKNKAVEVKIKLQNDFYGFTGWKPFTFYIGTLAIAFSFAVYSYFRNSDNQRLNEEKAIVLEYQKRIENLREKNPNIAKKYFY